MIPYSSVTWEISGVCNAACRYCPSGSKNILGNFHKSQAGFLSPEDFERGLIFMLDKGIIDRNVTKVDLYSWGEPFLHPQFETMLRIISGMGIGFGLSTNASILKAIPPETIPMLRTLLFSMPGFSQASYDRMHGFNFNQILENIKSMVSNVRGPNVGIAVVFHLYKFNKQEIDIAWHFCHDELNIGFIPLIAILTGFTMPINESHYRDIYLNDCLSGQWEVLKRMQVGEKTLWNCPQIDNLVLDEYSNVVQCCLTERYTKGNIIGKLNEIDFDNLKELKRTAPICVLCKEAGIGFLAANIDKGDLNAIY